jgi:hypothetical protein
MDQEIQALRDVGSIRVFLFPILFIYGLFQDHSYDA